MLKIIYDENGMRYSDHDIANMVKNEEYYHNIDNIIVHTSSHLVIDFFRMLVAERKIPFDKLRIYVKGEEFHVDEYGAIMDANYYHLLNDAEKDILRRIVKARIRKE